jgi:diketogulonate reductase-like aldo/keto reductase
MGYEELIKGVKIPALGVGTWGMGGGQISHLQEAESGFRFLLTFQRT